MPMDGRYPKNAGAILRVCQGMGGILSVQEPLSGYVRDVRYPDNAGAILRVCLGMHVCRNRQERSSTSLRLTTS